MGHPTDSCWNPRACSNSRLGGLWWITSRFEGAPSNLRLGGFSCSRTSQFKVATFQSFKVSPPEVSATAGGWGTLSRVSDVAAGSLARAPAPHFLADPLDFPTLTSQSARR